MAEASNSVLIVENDPEHVLSLRYWLEREGVRVRAAATGEQGLTCALDPEDPPALIILELTLPGMSGLDLCRRLRREPSTRKTPIIMVAACPSELEVVAALDVGADDFVTKSLPMRELVARARAVTRRAGLLFGAERYRDARLTVDYGAMSVTLDDTRVRLTRLEFEILAEMARSAGRVLTRERLIEKVWGHDYEGDPKTLGVHVMRLRQKLCDTGECIETVIGIGYRFVGFHAQTERHERSKAAGA